ncbi:DUF3179 domain-containing (seleno)protein [Halorubellus sp. PRR65]|uniref:DUF3179 domain-containing (seleno)protein n=1 Tax=Halorubellus sp. PRR65 TaxID=3098148 RepID=UPI002B25B414|nr:DUF3179 domain-containing (seleno)protein [Halorubellus sp. PRR65]
MPTDPSTVDDERRADDGDRTDATVLQGLVDDLLVQDADRHERALAELAAVGDERVVAHLVDAAALQAVASDWENLGFPEVFRGRDPPYAFQHPETRFPGVLDALCAVAPPEFDQPGVAWLQWESWYTQTDPDTLDGYVDWKVRFYRTYHPTVGHLLDVEPKHPDFDGVRWGSTDPTVLHPLNFPDWTTDDAHLADDDLVYGFRADDAAYAVPRYLLFPHEFANLDVGDDPLALTYCTMCNSPILYDATVENGSVDAPRQFASTGCLWNGNKLMYDEETLTLWNQQTGTPIAGPDYARHCDPNEPDVALEFRPVTQTTWGEWRDDHPDSAVVSRDTGYDLDYEFYRDYDGFVKRHYWENDDVFHPGVRAEESALDDRTAVYGVESDDGLHAFVVERVRDAWPVADEIDGRAVVALPFDGDVAVYDAPGGSLERADAADDGAVLVDGDGRRWRPTHDALVPADDEGSPRDRVSGRHGLWLAFRPHYETVHVAGTDSPGTTGSDEEAPER